jgi:hypothetical protein
VVREHEIGRQQRAHGGGVHLDVALAFLDREVMQQARLEPLVAIEDEDGEQAVGELRDDDARTAEVVPLGMPLLADDRDVVSRVAPLACERARVDVRARTSEEVPMPDEDLQVRWK